MSSDMKEAFKKAGYKEPESQSAATPHPRSAPKQFELEKNYAAQAEQVIQGLKKSMGVKYNNFTTSKIRNILAQVSEIYNDVNILQDEFLDPEIQNRIEYLKVRLAYEGGREPEIVKPFVNKAGLLDLLNNIGDSREKFIKFSRYMEALVAYHRFYGGKDK